MFDAYYWISFAVTLACGMYVPSKRLSWLDNAGANVVCALFGFLLWPMFLAAAVKTYRTKEQDK